MSENYTILIVEDDAAVLMALRQVLEREGYLVLTAVNGTEGLAVTREQPPDLVLCDYKMPGMNGVEVFQALASICPDAVRILITGQADLNVALAAINEGGVYKFVTKPWRVRDLTLMVQRALEHYQLRQEGKALMEMLEMALREQEVQVRGLKEQVIRYRQMLGMDAPAG